MKTCTKCHNTKALDSFYKRKRSPDGREAWCKSCRLKHNRKWIGANKDRHRELTQRWYDENKEHHLQNNKAWYQANKHRKLATNNARDQRCKDATPEWASMLEIQAVYQKAKAASEATGIPHEVDHIVPITHEAVCGLNIPNNLQVIPASENRRKANRIDHLDCWSGQQKGA
jgi:hypothetical protein